MRKSIQLLALGAFFSVAAACTNSTTTDNEHDTTGMEQAAGDSASLSTPGETASAIISATKADTTGNGRVEFSKLGDDQVTMSLTLSFPKLANKSVAVHFHEHGDCGNAGSEAHGHWNPTNEPHGKWGSAAHHSGDIGNIPLDAEGNGSITVTSNRWTIGGDDKTNIINRAVIVHSGVDDYQTQPTGNSGSRIGCGVISGK